VGCLDVALVKGDHHVVELLVLLVALHAWVVDVGHLLRVLGLGPKGLEEAHSYFLSRSATSFRCSFESWTSSLSSSGLRLWNYSVLFWISDWSIGNRGSSSYVIVPFRIPLRAERKALRWISSFSPPWRESCTCFREPRAICLICSLMLEVS